MPDPPESTADNLWTRSSKTTHSSSNLRPVLLTSNLSSTDSKNNSTSRWMDHIAWHYKTHRRTLIILPFITHATALFQVKWFVVFFFFILYYFVLHCYCNFSCCILGSHSILAIMTIKTYSVLFYIKTLCDKYCRPSLTFMCNLEHLTYMLHVNALSDKHDHLLS